MKPLTVFKNLGFSARLWPGLGLFILRRPRSVDTPTAITFALVLLFVSLELTILRPAKWDTDKLKAYAEEAYRELETAFNKYNRTEAVPGFLRKLQTDEGCLARNYFYDDRKLYEYMKDVAQ
jgi:hypothetical protein